MDQCTCLLLRLPFVVVLLLLVGASLGHACVFDFADRYGSSLSGRFHVHATSGDSAHKVSTRFTYTMTDATGRVLWVRQQASDEAAPALVSVDDTGWVLVRTIGGGAVALRPNDGSKTLDLSITALLREDEISHRTECGPVWEGLARTFFFSRQGRVFWVIRTSRRRHVIFDLAAGTTVPPQTSGLEEACREAAENTAVRTIQLGATLEKAEMDPAAARDLIKAIDDIGEAGRHDLVPELRILEGDRDRREPEHCYRMGPGDLGAPVGGRVGASVDPTHCFLVHRVRSAAQAAMRSMGEAPTNLPAITFFHAGSGDDLIPYSTDQSRKTMLHAAFVRKGDAPEDVLRMLGAPDGVRVESSTWLFIMDDSPEPVAVRVHWDDNNRMDDLDLTYPRVR